MHLNRKANHVKWKILQYYKRDFTCKHHISIDTCIDITSFACVPVKVLLSDLVDTQLGNNNAFIFYDISRSRVATAIGVTRLNGISIDSLPLNCVGEPIKTTLQVCDMILTGVYFKTLKSRLNKRSV